MKLKDFVYVNMVAFTHLLWQKVALVLGIILAFFLVYLLVSCGGDNVYPEPDGSLRADTIVSGPTGSYCGDYICDEELGEDYWNCIDCVDIYGGPKNGYCGDGICYNETMTSCWRDCKPKRYNSRPDWPEFWSDPGSEPNPGPPLPGPDPGPF